MIPLSTNNLCNYRYHFIITILYLSHASARKACDVRVASLKFASERDGEISNEESRSRPLLEETAVTTVKLSLTINEFNILDAKNLDVEIDLEMTQRWNDSRLGPDYKTRRLAAMGAIWNPKITFVVGNNCPDIAGNDRTQFWRGTSDGSVFYSERFLVKPRCTKDLTKYPFDKQICYVKIGSYRFTAEEVSLEWTSGNGRAVESRVDEELGEFRIQGFNDYGETEVRSAGNFSVLVLEIYLARYSRREVIQSILPSFALVKIAYGSLWMKPSGKITTSLFLCNLTSMLKENFAGIRTRIITCQLSLLGTLFMFLNSNCRSWNLSHLKALDIWFLICLVLILIPLAESILIHHLNPADVDNFGCNENEHEAGKKWIVWMEKVISFLHPLGLLISTLIFFTAFNGEGENIYTINW
ncbi:gamma-aminobutyric acid receptor exp-1-like isoform X1 [Neodiprion virginianus]|uniref:gamma-aminobutyric acid receptor exp-1-like isoform X1 n=1 Tax=Neodiprion virginianus TaxID=2961670 RepID=UPI001EE6EB60|nr:gamma-aminobutyric acid receptor exp-1-like isoform X1 [Neodiprion virginianus]